MSFAGRPSTLLEGLPAECVGAVTSRRRRRPRAPRARRSHVLHHGGTVSPDCPALARRVCDLCAVRDTEGCAATPALAAASCPSGEPAVIMRLHLCVQSGGAQGAGKDVVVRTDKMNVGLRRSKCRTFSTCRRRIVPICRWNCCLTEGSAATELADKRTLNTLVQVVAC
jgi:hypothetical protein